MTTILIYIVMAVEAILGVGSTLAIMVLLFGTIGYKIYRKAKHGISLYN